MSLTFEEKPKEITIDQKVEAIEIMKNQYMEYAREYGDAYEPSVDILNEIIEDLWQYNDLRNS